MGNQWIQDGEADAEQARLLGSNLLDDAQVHHHFDRATHTWIDKSESPQLGMDRQHDASMSSKKATPLETACTSVNTNAQDAASDTSTTPLPTTWERNAEAV